MLRERYDILESLWHSLFYSCCLESVEIIDPTRSKYYHRFSGNLTTTAVSGLCSVKLSDKIDFGRPVAEFTNL